MSIPINPELKSIIENYDSTGKLYIQGNRNSIKLFNYEGILINIKSFKIPNFLNSFIYRFIRKTKARRSYEFANILISKNIGTPKPIAYYEVFGTFRLKESYYISNHLDNEITFRDISLNNKYPEFEIICQQFAAFCYKLHQKGIEFLDHSAGNTLIKKRTAGQYDFYLVDLNRMKFHKKMSLKKRIKNLARLTSNKEMIKRLSHEYALISGDDEPKVFKLWCDYAFDFNEKLEFKKRLKKLFFLD